MKKILVVALVLLLLASNSLGVLEVPPEPNEHSKKPEIINVPNSSPNCPVRVINFTTTPTTIKCKSYDFQV